MEEVFGQHRYLTQGTQAKIYSKSRNGVAFPLRDLKMPLGADCGPRKKTTSTFKEPYE